MKTHWPSLGCRFLILSFVLVGAGPLVGATQDQSAATLVSPEAKAVRHDPFQPLLDRGKLRSRAIIDFPAGPAGLLVGGLQLTGILKSARGLIAVVTNPQGRTYFLREGAQLYDGRVEKITMDGVSFRELGKDAFGRPSQRQVSKRIYSSGAGEQQ